MHPYICGMLQRCITTLCALLCLGFASAQTSVSDTLLTMGGRIIPCDIVDTLSLEIKFEVTNKRGKVKQRVLDRSEVFAIVDSTFHLIYEQDESVGNWMTPEQVAVYVAGSQDARACYNEKPAFWIPFAVSAGTAFLAQGGLVTTMLAPIVFTGYHAIPVFRLKIDEMCISDKSHTWNEDYAMGYERVARGIKLISALKGGSLGMALGLVVYILFPL